MLLYVLTLSPYQTALSVSVSSDLGIIFSKQTY